MDDHEPTDIDFMVLAELTFFSTLTLSSEIMILSEGMVERPEVPKSIVVTIIALKNFPELVTSVNEQKRHGEIALGNIIVRTSKCSLSCRRSVAFSSKGFFVDRFLYSIIPRDACQFSYPSDWLITF